MTSIFQTPKVLAESIMRQASDYNRAIIKPKGYCDSLKYRIIALVDAIFSCLFKSYKQHRDKVVNSYICNTKVVFTDDDYKNAIPGGFRTGPRNSFITY